MKLIVISPEEEREDEVSVLDRLCAAGLLRYHVRKPTWRRGKLAQWLDGVPERVRERLVLHTHHGLVDTYGLLGRHWRDQPGLPPPGSGFSSRACHSIETARAHLGVFSSLILSPIFPSITKPGYAKSWDRNQLMQLRIDREDCRRKTELIALGGVSGARFAACASMGFDGAAVMGAVWQAEDPIAAFTELQEKLEGSRATEA